MRSSESKKNNIKKARKTQKKQIKYHKIRYQENSKLQFEYNNRRYQVIYDIKAYITVVLSYLK